MGNVVSQALRSVTCAVVAAYSGASLAYVPLDCLNDAAKADPEIIIGLATKLCAGAWSPEPVKCYAVVSKVDEIPRGIAIDLCAGSVSAENTVACYIKAATERKLNRGLSMTLCGAKKVER